MNGPAKAIKIGTGEREEKCMNKVILMGRLTREPEADFFNCAAFGKQAEFIERYMPGCWNTQKLIAFNMKNRYILTIGKICAGGNNRKRGRLCQEQ